MAFFEEKFPPDSRFFAAIADDGRKVYYAAVPSDRPGWRRAVEPDGNTPAQFSPDWPTTEISRTDWLKLFAPSPSAPISATQIVNNLPVPTAADMAGELLITGNNLILDHYSCTQGRRVMSMIDAEPLTLLVEMWRASRRLNITQVQIAEKVTGKPWTTIHHEVLAEMKMEAYQSLYPAVPTPRADDLKPAQVRRMMDWLRSMASHRTGAKP